METPYQHALGRALLGVTDPSVKGSGPLVGVPSMELTRVLNQASRGGV